MFFEISKVVSRYSECPEDYLLDQKAFINKNELRTRIFETKKALQDTEKNWGSR